jgi:hypothetical protein
MKRSIRMMFDGKAPMVKLFPKHAAPKKFNQQEQLKRLRRKAEAASRRAIQKRQQAAAERERQAAAERWKRHKARRLVAALRADLAAEHALYGIRPDIAAEFMSVASTHVTESYAGMGVFKRRAA